MKKLLLALIKFYRSAISPHTAPSCKYTPTCSQYGLEAIERFGAVRCRELLKNEKEQASDAVRALGVTNHCGVMIATAVEIVEEMLKEEEK